MTKPPATRSKAELLGLALVCVILLIPVVVLLGVTLNEGLPPWRVLGGATGLLVLAVVLIYRGIRRK